MTNIDSRKAWTVEITSERIDALDRMDTNVPGVNHSETARRLSEGREEIGPFSPQWVSRQRGKRPERQARTKELTS